MKWRDTNPGINDEDTLTLKKIPYNFPLSYLNFLKISDGGMPDTSHFDFFDVSFKSMMGQGVGIFYSLVSGEINLIKEYFDPPEFFPRDLVGFAETGNGDIICFDYRKDPTTDNPSIVYWRHDAPEGEDVSFLANNFEDFLGMLKEPEELPSF